ncbi:MAG: permease [Rhodospirillaceae bacterium]|nr:permease [Rhodospirillaceae bacterium]
MDIYMPIAEMSVNVPLILAVGAGVGLLSGLFGVGGGFLMTPLLFFIGIPSAVAVATGASLIVAASISGVLAHWKRGNVDFRMGSFLLVGGVFGSSLGVWLFTVLREQGHIDLVIRVSYVVFLAIIGGLMLVESARSMMRRKKNQSRRSHIHTWLHGLPFKVRFRRSRLYISALPPLAVGLFVGLLAGIMGVGGGFVMVPAMIYVLGMPTAVVVGTSLFQIIFVSANVTILQSATNQTVDILLALILLFGGVLGAQLGARIGAKMQGEQLRGLLALIVLGVCVKLTYDLVLPPADLFSIAEVARY